MNTHADKTQENKSQAVSAVDSQMQSGGEATFQFVDNRPEAIAQRKLQEMANNSAQVSQLKAFQDMANNSPQGKQTTQLQEMADNHSAQQQQPIQKKENNTGLPDNLKTGMENLSGMSLDDVKVHRNSDKPAQLQAHAYAQGTDIHLGPRQEKHLPHEAWHVVQQKQGRVKPTVQMKGKVNVNDDIGLEKEADVMGDRAIRAMPIDDSKKQSNPNAILGQKSTVQREVVSTGGNHYDPVNELLTESGDVDADHVNDLLYGLAGARGKTQGRIRKKANDGDQANDKRTIDEYNRIIGLGGIIQPMYAGFMIYKVRQALEDPNNWKSIITGCKEDYSEAEGSNNVQKWMALLVKHKQNIGLYDLGNSTRPVIGKTLFGRDKLGEAAGVTKIKEKRRFEKNMGEEDSGKFSESDVHKMLSFGSDFDSAYAYYLSLEKNKQTPIGRWIQMAFWRRTSKLGIDFATSVEGLDANVHFNLSSSEANQDALGNTVYGELRLWGILDDIAADKGTRKITESEWRHVKKLIQKDPSLADRIHGYSEK